MIERKKHSFLQGALILTVAAIIVKIVGALFKIPLNNILGGHGMGFFSTAYDLYMPVYVLSNAGLPVAIARVVAECASTGRYRDVRKILRLANLIFFFTGTLGFCVMFFGAGFFVRTINNPGAYLAVMAMAPTVFFVCLTSSLRGYYEGLQNMYPTAISQVVEVVIKLVVGFGLSMWIFKTGTASYEATGYVFGHFAENAKAAELLVLQYAAMGAIIGVSAGAAMSALAIFLRHKIVGDGITKIELEDSPSPLATKTIVKKIVFVAIPIALGSCVGQLTGLIDLWSVLNRLGSAVSLDYSTIANMYGAAIPAGTTLASIPNYLNGCYKGMAVTLYNLIPTFTVAMGVSALPPITVAWTKKDAVGLKRNVEAVLRITMLVAIPAGIGMAVMSPQILRLLFSARQNEVVIAAPLLSLLGIAVIFAASCSPINSMLQAVGRADLPVKIMVVCAIIKLALNYTLVGIPSVNIRGAAVGTLVCYVLIMSISLFFLFRITKFRPNYKSVFIKPTICGIICAASAYGGYALFSLAISEKLATVLGIGLGAVVYIVSLILIRAISTDDIEMLPKGKKLVQLYEKLPGIKKRG